MMFTFKLLSIASIAFASVTIVAAGGDLKLCTGLNLSGTCRTISYLNNDCIYVGSALEDKVKSVDPLTDGDKCYLFEDQDCEGEVYSFTKHHNDLGSFNNRASSFYCNNA